MRRWIAIRYEQMCGGYCGRMLPAGTRVLWDPEEWRIVCESCAELEEPEAVPV